MRTTVQARLDPESERTLRKLRRDTGMTDSEIIRRALRVLGSLGGDGGRPRIVGLGAFASGVPDLGSNKRHLASFGRK